MKIAETEQFLNKMLLVAGFDPAAPDPLVIWAAFKLLLHQGIDDCEDGGTANFLVEWGTSRRNGTRYLYLNFVRMFTIYRDGEYHHTRETRCDMECNLASECGDIQDESGPLERGSVERNVFDLERRDMFRMLLRWHGPWQAEVYHQQQ
jgi:hypothetical protein